MYSRSLPYSKNIELGALIQFLTIRATESSWNIRNSTDLLSSGDPFDDTSQGQPLRQNGPDHHDVGHKQNQVSFM